MVCRWIYLDFDGTVVEHAYPAIGKPNPFALETIKMLQDKGHRIILNSTRVEFEDGSLQAALDYLNTNPHIPGIKIIHHTMRKLNPQPWHRDKLKRAQYIYIDDMATDIPKHITAEHGFMVDWTRVKLDLVCAGIL
jgi:hypothetical protein